MRQNLPCCVKHVNLYILGKGKRKGHCLPYSSNRRLTFKFVELCYKLGQQRQVSTFNVATTFKKFWEEIKLNRINRLLPLLHKLRSQLRGLFFIWFHFRSSYIWFISYTFVRINTVKWPLIAYAGNIFLSFSLNLSVFVVVTVALGDHSLKELQSATWLALY